MTATTSARQISNLPVDVTSFVGRRHEVPEVQRLLRQSRLVTLTGAGGVGKSRLARQVAGNIRASSVDEIWLVDLAVLRHGTVLARSVAEMLGIRVDSADRQVSSLVDYLNRKRVLLVLDNCEHLLQDCAELTETLLRAASTLRVIATSRQAMGVRGEHVFVVPSLSIPDPPDHRPRRELPRYEAVILLAERARMASPDFDLDAQDPAAVVRLCQRLDGIPLAIELAAAQLRTLSLPRIVELLEDYFELLLCDEGTALPRHQTLRATLDWSYDLCSPQERALWARLSVFSGNLDLEDAEEVCADSGLDRDDILDAVTGLVDKSILMRTQRYGNVRYRLLETVRQYGKRILQASGEWHTMRHRHRDWYVRLATSSEEAWLTPAELEWVARLQDEHYNLRTALEFSLDQPGEAPHALAIAAGLANYWYASGRMVEGHHWLRAGLDLATDPTRVRAKALWADGRCVLLRGDPTGAPSVVDQCAALAQHLDDKDTWALATQDRAMIEMLYGDAHAAVTLLEEALRGFRAAGDDYGAWYTLYLRALTESVLGRTDRAVANAEQSLYLSEARHAGWSRSQALWVLGATRWWRGDNDVVPPVLESLRIKRRLQDQLGVALCVGTLAWAAEAAGEHRRAARLLGACDTMWQKMGSSPALLRTLEASHRLCEERTRQVLGPRTYAAAFRLGARYSQQEVIDYALAEYTTADTDPEPDAGFAMTPDRGRRP
jgi:predicted ATPase